MHSTLFKLLPVASAAALLAACGGSDTAGLAADAPQVPWASPAMIVPPGAASKTIPLTACGSGFQTVTLVVNSSGDMIVSGAPSGTTTISEIIRLNYATAGYKSVSGQNSASGPSASVSLSDASGYIQADVFSGGGSFYSTKVTPAHNFGCSLVNGSASFALTTLPSSARLASQMTNGITGVDTSTQPGASATFVSGVATWDGLGGGSSPYRYTQLNVNTGALGSSANSTGTFATTVITLPTTPTSTYAYFNEDIDNGNKGFYAAIQQTSGTFALNIQRIANLLKPDYYD
jgi:hypothetical protein